MMMHTGEKHYIFHILYLCGKSFPNKNSFKCHEITHIGKKARNCNICLKSFKYTYDLKGHKMLHGLPQHLHFFVYESFSLNGIFKRHIQIHDEDGL